MQRRSQSGNVLFIILIAIALMGALTFTLTKSENATSTMSTQEASIAAEQIITYASKVESTVELLMNSGATDTTISFEGGPSGTYTNASATAGTKVFGASPGGALPYEAPKTAWLVANQYSASAWGDWFFTGDLCVQNIGTGIDPCASGPSTTAELVMMLPFLTKDICAAINTKLGIKMNNGDPYNNGGSLYRNSSRFTGTYATINQVHGHTGITVMHGKNAVCIKNDAGISPEPSNSYYFIKVLLAR